MKPQASAETQLERIREMMEPAEVSTALDSIIPPTEPVFLLFSVLDSVRYYNVKEEIKSQILKGPWAQKHLQPNRQNTP